MAKQNGGGLSGETTSITDWVDSVVAVITNDGRNLVGTLRGYDQATNLILADSHERVFSSKSGVEQVPLGLYFVRGDNVAMVGEVDEDLDTSQQLQAIRAEPLKPIRL